MAERDLLHRQPMINATLKLAAEADIAFVGVGDLGPNAPPMATEWIVVVMVIGWLLVALVEWLAWQSETAVDRPPAPAEAEPAPEESTSWDIEEILAPQAEDEA